MIHGETVTVKHRTISYDDAGNRTDAWDDGETVENVLVAPGTTLDVRLDDRVSGTQVALTLGFPKTYAGQLRGCLVNVRGRDYAVIGDPQPNTLANCPTQWYYTASVGVVDG